MSRMLSIVCLLSFTSAAAAQGPTEPLVKKVKTSITRGVAFLVSKQKPDGGWEHNDTAHKGGASALAVLALVNCEGVVDDPGLEKKRKQSIEQGLTYLRGLNANTVYVRSLQTMALAEARHPRDKEIIEANAKWLLDARVMKNGRFIGWEYYSRPNAPATDGSNSQYAMLGLWYARQAGVKFNADVWVGIRDYYLQTQNADGSWIYSPDYGPNDKASPSYTMTIAGLCGLLIAGMELNGEREQWLPGGQIGNCGIYGETTPIARTLQWVNKNFALELSAGRTYYHLYGLERAGRLSGLRFFGEHDWYREGCEVITKRQSPDGSWRLDGEWDNRWPTYNSSFALLFLSRGRTPVLISKLVHGNWPRSEVDLDWNNDRNDLRHLTEYLAQTDLFGKKPLAWQTYDIKRALEARLDKNPAASAEDEAAVVADMLQSPILCVSGHKSPLRRFQGGEIPLIKRYLENGGFLFAEACCGDPNFDAGFKEWVKENWPGHELTYLESTHPVWTCQNIIPAGEPYKLMGLQVGCKTIMIYSPQDLSCYWESNRPEKDGRTQLAFRLGANIVAYATGKVPPQPRLTPIAVASDRPTRDPRKRGFFQIGQIYHAGDWQPAPKAMTNLLAHVQERFGMEVMPRVVKVFSPETYRSSKFLYLHGRNEFRVAPDHQEALRFTLENGGLLLADACCGNEKFDKSFRQLMQELFPKEKLQPVPIDPERDNLFGAELNGEVLSASNIQCRIKANGPLVAMEPFLEGIRIQGRWVVLYSKYDLGCALERHTSADCIGYAPASALRIATAAVRYNARP